MITWLHLSDLHLRSKDYYNNSVIQEAFFADLADFLKDKELKIDLVFFTGDIAFSGVAEDYKLACKFLDNLIDVLKIDKDDIFLVPGNHDVNRGTKTFFSENMASLLENRDAVTQVLSDERDTVYSYIKFAEYYNFINSYFGDSRASNVINKNIGNYAYMLSISGIKVAILGLNSAWLSFSDNDRNNLVIGEKQVRETLDKARNADIKIALVHHPLNWLKEFDKNDCEAILSRNCDFLLRGHLHKTRIDFITSPDSSVITISAGTLYEDRTYPNAYNIVQLDLDKKEGLIYFRRYSDETAGFFAKDTLIYQNAPDGEYRFLLKSSKFDQSTTIADEFLTRLSRIVINQNGLKRTAYPTDMNFRELYEQEVYVNPIFINLGLEGSSKQIVTFQSVFEKIASGNSLLVLGEPGSGKSYFTYLIERKLVELESKTRTLCLPIDLRLFIGSIEHSNHSFDQAFIFRTLYENYKSQGIELPNDYRTSYNLVFIVDGIDELSSNLAYIKLLPPLLSTLASIGCILVTCRTRDFDNVFAPHIDSSLFNVILKVKEWEVETEFNEFIQKLVKACLFKDDGFYRKVKSSPALRSLVQRPLYARMLTFINKTELGELTDISQLYSEYLQKYSLIVDKRLIKEECLSESKTYMLWSETAWFVFIGNLFLHDKIPFSALNDLLIQKFGIRPSCVAKILNPIFNFIQIFNDTLLQYVHYSFYEYLIAEYMAQGLLSTYYQGSNDVYKYFSKDMTPEIRHHLMRVLNKIKPPGFGKWLAHGYISNNEVAPNLVGRQIANNLLVYILGRLNEDLSEEMWKLLRMENDHFLQNCLFWGLSATAGIKGAEEFLKNLNENINMRHLNRGYLLYYYGDLDRSKNPPYLDDDPKRSWSNTRIRTLNFMSEHDYANKISVGRRIIDLYTFYDYCIFRNEILSEGLSTVYKVLNSIEQEIGNTKIVATLREMHTKVVGQKSLLEELDASSSITS